MLRTIFDPGLGPSAVLALAVGALVAGCRSREPDPRPNIVLIVLDDVGIEKLSCYTPSADGAKTPHLDRLRQEGVLFRNAYAMPVCGPTRAALQTGRYGFRTGFGRNIRHADTWQLDDREVLIPELLRFGFERGRGYQSGAFGKWHLARPGNARHPIANGFDRFSGTLFNSNDNGDGPHHYHWQHTRGDARQQFTETCGSDRGPFDEFTWDAAVQAHDAIEWMSAQREPFFAYVALNPPHSPLQVPPWTLVSAPMRERLERGGHVAGRIAQSRADAVLYADACIEAIDTLIGRMLDGLGREREKTTVIVVGDNGSDPKSVDESVDPSRVKLTVYQAGIRVPLIVSGSGVAPDARGRESAALISVTDLWRTVGDLAGASSVAARPLEPQDSQSFAQLLRDPAAAGARDLVFVEYFTDQPMPGSGNKPFCLRAILDGSFKYVTRLGGSPELYDLRADPEERADLLLEPELGDEARAALEHLRAEIGKLAECR